MDNREKYREILESHASKIIVKAGPGTGKTSQIMLPRASMILSNPDISASEIILLSFSRMAALDLKKKIETFERSPRTATVHSLCLSFLMSQNDHRIRDRISSILLEFEKDVLLSDLKEIFPHIHKNNLKKDLKLFSAAWSEKPEEEIFEETEERKNFKRAVMNWLSEYKACIMEEIVYSAVVLGRANPDTDFINGLKYIFVDEFQDLNKLEQEFISIVSEKYELLFITGDPDQSIYSFKFAHPQGMDDYSTSQSGVESYTIPFTARSAKKIVYFANQLLSQQDPTRIDLLQPITTQIDGEVKFVKKYSQPEEFDTVIESVRELIVNGESPSNIMILAPRRGLAKKFIEHSEEREPENVKFQFVSKIEFSLNEQERILLLSLIANPNSILHKRSYIGMTDPTHFSKEINKLKSVYGSLEEVLAQAKKEDCRPVEKRKQQVCERITFLREFLLAHNSEQGLAVVLEELFPIDNEELKSMNSLLQDLTEEGDSVKTVYAKFVDYVRALPETDSIVRVMTPLSSKGLEANHVFIIGCNQGNIPGTRTLEHITDHEHVQEQRRILYVTFTRAIKTLTVSWSRYIPFEQALGHNTARVSSVPRRINGVLMSEVGICEFLEDLNGAVWIT